MFQVIGGRSVQVARLLAPRSAVLVEAVRGRKSRTDPVAKSKEGRIKVPPPVDPVEMVVLKERYTEYKLIMRALRLEFKEEVLRKKYEEETGSQAEERARQEAEEHRALMGWNNEENLRMLKARILRVQKEAEEAERKKIEAAIQREQEQQEFIKEKEREILQLQEEVKNFITTENLDQRIEEALDNPKNYNFAVNKEGKVIKQTVLQ
ncbi:small ribosomal subunit protein mS26 [Maylandia zebra]|uniref:Small ribosomal subunit protein mS26 n=3 Tax=Haplochromini TaxID=319058 RepID=A0A3Q2VDR2_HAPBU|nr:28S ribosomal protein S26, mitochondrial [Maylandia zebra]XP_005929685.1 28S ribosomal protein S26, mitochondrial [Haplochromis burtoni]XP_026008879.1 28S ribosomal protein S26, mitochondrial [Astatotilapia calliptera]